ncbi:MAG: acyl-ACP--UDP-N-acetylglucosamine O-acyltransferase [Verrucomicrobiales bacterium]|nr:acyl-ACP--UDP-N-acetylglucosamine O-acyltransferase [Verrucomicrobiales bacterium]
MKIHPTAIVHPDARIGEGVTIGPWVLIEAGVELGAGCRIDAQAQILNSVVMGENCVVSGGAIIGGDPQDIEFDRDTPSRVVIGKGNTFRENVTIHRGASENSATRIGDSNFLMVGSHIGHDAKVGNCNILANDCLLGGFVKLGDGSFLGGGSAFHQFVRIGDLTMVKGLAAVSRDVPHYTTVCGSNQVSGLNVIGMRRSGFSNQTRLNVKTAFDHMYRSGLNLTQALASAVDLALEREALHFIEFFRNPSRKGICMR